MKTILNIAGLSALALATGCVSLLPEPAPPPNIYRLVTSIPAVEKVASPEIIRVDRPTAPQLYNANDIVVTMDGQKLSTIAQAKWSETTPELTQDALIEALAGSRNFIGLLPTSGASVETRLQVTIKNFEASFDQGPESAPLAVIDYRVAYTRSDDRSLLGTHTVRQTQRADSIAVPSIVRALESANNAAVRDIVAWLETQRTENPA